MFFNRSLSAVAPKASRTRAEVRSPRRRAAALRLETLEGRDLKAAGITSYYGQLFMTGTLGSGNSGYVRYEGNEVVATLNGEEARFNASEISSISYWGATGGGDTFVNDTGLFTQIFGFGGRNKFEGGTGTSYVTMHGDDNTYNSDGGISIVTTYGTGNSIEQDPSIYVTSYSIPSYYSFYW